MPKRMQGAEALARDRDDVAERIAQYETLLRTSTRAASRRFAIRALGRVPRGTTALLARALSSDTDEDVRAEAVHALAPRIDDAAARGAVVRAVADPSVAVAVTALGALASRRESDVATALAMRLGSGPAEVQRLLESMLADIHREDPLPFLDWMMGGDVPERLVPAIRVLEAIASPITAPLLEHVVRSRSPAVRVAAVRALAALPSPNLALIDELTGDGSEEVRLAALEARARVGH